MWSFSYVMPNLDFVRNVRSYVCLFCIIAFHAVNPNYVGPGIRISVAGKNALNSCVSLFLSAKMSRPVYEQAT